MKDYCKPHICCDNCAFDPYCLSDEIPENWEIDERLARDTDNLPIPTFEQAKSKIDNCEPLNSLEMFVYNNTPILDKRNADRFTRELKTMIEYIKRKVVEI